MKYPVKTKFRAITVYTFKLGLSCSIFVITGGCMKQQCYECVTTFPLIANDTFVHMDSLHTHCDITIEKAKHIEQSGTFKKDYIIGGQTKTLDTKTICARDE